MKIDKRNPAHWLALLAFFGMAALGWLWRFVVPRRDSLVVLYGHKLNGNLLALHRYMQANPDCGFHPVYLSMDRSYLAELRDQGVDCCWASGFACVGLLARAKALISDHGLHSLQPWLAAYQRLGLKFFDVWHGMSTMEYRPEETVVRQKYDEIWVASKLYREVYSSRFGFDRHKVVVTGHARSDQLVDKTCDQDEIRKRFELPSGQKLILFAPTWKQKMKSRSIYPFGCEETKFLSELSELAVRCNVGFVIREHLNSGGSAHAEGAGVYSLPAHRFPDTEAILMACDVLVCDWSTIAFDWLLLDRPALFLDVEPPYPLGRFLGPEFRFGAVVRSIPEFIQTLSMVLSDDRCYWTRCASRHQAAKDKFYGGMADGGAAARCIQRLKAAL